MQLFDFLAVAGCVLAIYGGQSVFGSHKNVVTLYVVKKLPRNLPHFFHGFLRIITDDYG
jgi:hypothetical protein